MGFQPYIDKEQQGPIITTFLYPQGVHISFGNMYHFMKERGYAIYPGKLTCIPSALAISVISYEEDILQVCRLFKEFLESCA